MGDRKSCKAKSIRVEERNGSLLVYVDPFNKRIRIDDFRGNTHRIIAKAEQLAKEHHAEKLIFKVRREHLLTFYEQGFQPEAVADRYFLGSDAFFFSKFFKAERRNTEHWIMEEQILEKIYGLIPSKEHKTLPPSYTLKHPDEKDAEELAFLYKQIFEIYPVPLHDPEYIKKTMKKGVIYLAFVHQGKMVSAASAELNDFYKNAELTDCATLQEHRKYGLMKILLKELESTLQQRGIYCVYSISRALSYGMNAVLFQLGYRFRGRLVNNCYIYDKLENMNMWVKDLSCC